MKPVGRVGDIRSCGAIITYSLQSSVFSNGRQIAVVGSGDSHGGFALSTATATFIEGRQVVLLGDLNTSCTGPGTHSGPHALATGDYNVFGT